MAEIDPKQLELGTQIATKSGTKLSIIRFLGEGGQEAYTRWITVV